MRLIDLISPEAIIPCLKATTKKQAMMELSEKASQLCGLPARAIFNSLLQRERLGSTGIGEGVAIPHGKIAKLKSIFGIFARLERPIDFDSLDGEPVDLLFLLMTPEVGWRRSPQSARLRSTHVARHCNGVDDPRHT